MNKGIAILLITILILNLIFFGLGKIPLVWFWIIIAVIGFIAWLKK